MSAQIRQGIVPSARCKSSRIFWIEQTYIAMVEFANGGMPIAVLLAKGARVEVFEGGAKTIKTTDDVVELAMNDVSIDCTGLEDEDAMRVDAGAEGELLVPLLKNWNAEHMLAALSLLKNVPTESLR